MNRILNHIQSSKRLQYIIVWSIIFFISFAQMIWAGIVLAMFITFITFVSLLTIYFMTQVIFVPILLMKRKRYGYIFFSSILLVSLAYICSGLEIYIFQYFEVESKDGSHFVFALVKFLALFILTFAASNIILFSKKTTKDKKQKEKLLLEKRILETRVLKSQINSHFIFNALNNIYSMVYFKDEYTSCYILKLAQMMRYVMEDCDTEFTPLAKEIEYIGNYIDFQKLRLEDDQNIVFTCNIKDNVNISVPPMLFQPFVENCFKYAPLEVDQKGYVHIDLEVNNHQIRFTSKNNQPFLKNNTLTERIGIGIKNVKRRLFLYYGDNYSMDISDCTEYFKVELLIRL